MVSPCDQQDLDLLVVAAAHRVERVAQQVDDDLLDPERVGLHDRRLRGQRGHDLDRHLAELRRHHRERRAHAVAQVDRLDVDVALAGIGLELAGDAAHAVDQVVDALERGERLLRPPPGQEQPRAGEIGLHRRQRLVELVADRGRHLAEGGELRGLLEALLGFLEVLLHPLPRADLRREPPVQHPQLLGFALDAPALGAGAPREQVEGEREEERQHHDDQRQDRVHPGADVLERGEIGEPPVAEADRHLGGRCGVPAM